MGVTRTLANTFFIIWLSISLYQILSSVESVILKKFSEVVTFTKFSVNYLNFFHSIITSSLTEILNLLKSNIMIVIIFIFACLLITLSTDSAAGMIFQDFLYNIVLVIIAVYNSLGVVSIQNYSSLASAIFELVFREYLMSFTMSFLAMLIITSLFRVVFLKRK